MTAAADVVKERNEARAAATRVETPEPELGDAHKEAFRKLGASMSFVGIVGILFGVMAAVGAVVALAMAGWPQAVALGVTAVIQIVTSFWTASAGRSMTSIYATRGKDVTYLMQGVTQLRRLYGLAMVLIVVFGAAGLLLVGYAFAGEGKRVIRAVLESFLP